MWYLLLIIISSLTGEGMFSYLFISQAFKEMVPICMFLIKCCLCSSVQITVKRQKKQLDGMKSHVGRPRAQLWNDPVLLVCLQSATSFFKKKKRSGKKRLIYNPDAIQYKDVFSSQMTTDLWLFRLQEMKNSGKFMVYWCCLVINRRDSLEAQIK